MYVGTRSSDRRTTTYVNRKSNAVFFQFIALVIASASTDDDVRSDGKVERDLCARVLILLATGGLFWPGEESYSSSGPELLGVVTSHGPSRESYTSAQKS